MFGNHKFLFIFLSIITLGIFPLIVYFKTNNDKTNNELSSNEKLSVNLDKLKQNLGGMKNIFGVEFTYTKVKIFIHDRNLVNLEQIQKIKGISGVFASSGAITIIVGNSAKKLANLLLS